MEHNKREIDKKQMTPEKLAFLLTSMMLTLPNLLIIARYPSRGIAMLVTLITVSTIVILARGHYKENHPYKAEPYILISLYYLWMLMQIRSSAQIELMALVAISGTIGILGMYNNPIITIMNVILGLFTINFTYFTSEVGVVSTLPYYTVFLMQCYFAGMVVGLGKLNQMLAQLTAGIKSHVVESEGKAQKITDLLDRIKSTMNASSQIGETVKENMKTIDDASSHITTSIEGCTHSMIEETQTVQEVNGSLDEIRGYISTIVSSSEEMLYSSKATKNTVEEGVKKADDLFESMDQVSIAAGKTQGAMTELREQMNNVDTIVQTIKRISDQTNLLSFNASIESARVGEHGKGFAVVADNIRALANQSKEATMDISNILKRFEEIINIVMQNMEIEQKSVQVSQESKGMVQKVFVEMEQTVIKTTNQTELVKTKLDNLSQLSININQNMEKINDLTTSNSSAMQEVMARIEEQTASIADVNSDVIVLDQLTSELNEVVNEK